MKSTIKRHVRYIQIIFTTETEGIKSTAGRPELTKQWWGWKSAPRLSRRTFPFSIVSSSAFAIWLVKKKNSPIHSHVGLVQVQVDGGQWQGGPTRWEMWQQRGEEGVLCAVFLAEMQQVGAARQQCRCLFVSGALSDPLRPRLGRRKERSWRGQWRSRRRTQGWRCAQHWEGRGQRRGGAG